MSAKELVPAQVVHEYVECLQEQRFSCLKYLLQREYSSWMNESSSQESSSRLKKFLNKNKPQSPRPFRAMVFVDEEDIAPTVTGNGFVSLRTTLSGDNLSSDVLIASLSSIFPVEEGRDRVKFLGEFMSLDERADSLNAFRDGLCPVILATGCAARGIDIPSITHVFQVHFEFVNLIDEYD